MDFFSNMNLITDEVLYTSILISLGSLMQIKYMIDYNRNKITKEPNPIITMVLYIMLIFSYEIMAIGCSNSYTLDYFWKSRNIIIILCIIILLLSLFTLTNDKLSYDNKSQQIMFCILIIILFPIGFALSICKPIFSIIAIPYTYFKEYSRK